MTVPTQPETPEQREARLLSRVSAQTRADYHELPPEKKEVALRVLEKSLDPAEVEARRKAYAAYTRVRASAKERAWQWGGDDVVKPEPPGAYGYCPLCGAPGVSRERRPAGNDTCGNGHTYPSRMSLVAPEDFDGCDRCARHETEAVRWRCYYEQLRDKVRPVFLQEGDDHCWRDLYTAETAALVGIKDWVPKVLGREEMLENGGRFVDCLLSGKHYPTTDEVRQENAALRGENERLKARIAALTAVVNPGE